MLKGKIKKWKDKVNVEVTDDLYYLNTDSEEYKILREMTLPVGSTPYERKNGAGTASGTYPIIPAGDVPPVGHPVYIIRIIKEIDVPNAVRPWNKKIFIVAVKPDDETHQKNIEWEKSLQEKEEIHRELEVLLKKLLYVRGDEKLWSIHRQELADLLLKKRTYRIRGSAYTVDLMKAAKDIEMTQRSYPAEAMIKTLYAAIYGKRMNPHVFSSIPDSWIRRD